MYVDNNDGFIAEQLTKNKALFTLENDENPADATAGLEPTIANLQEALLQSKVKTKDYLHEGSGIIFKLCAMSSAGYTALHNVERFNPMTGAKISTNQEDERERSIIYLMHGISQPVLNRQLAENILDAPHWGPSNIGLLDAISELNPSAEQRINKFMILMGLARFQVIWFKVLEETGGLDKFCEENNIKDDIKESLRSCFDMFSYLFSIEETAKSWGMPLGIGALTKPISEAQNQSTPKVKQPKKKEEKIEEEV